jgi:hypothetical protein
MKPDEHAIWGASLNLYFNLNNYKMLQQIITQYKRSTIILYVFVKKYKCKFIISLMMADFDKKCENPHRQPTGNSVHTGFTRFEVKAVRTTHFQS